MKSMKSVFGAAVLMLCLPAVAQESSHDGAYGEACATPVDAKLVVENERVQVFRMSIPAHAHTPMHDVTPRVVVWLSDAHFVDRYADGKSVEESRKAGDAEWVAARRHAGENLSDRPMDFIAVVLKQAAGAAPAPHPHGAH